MTARFRNLDVACVGETMIQVVPTGPLPLREAERFQLTHGGAESNVALQLARLGDTVSWVSRLGTDALGDRILDALGDARIDVSQVRRDPERSTGVYFKDPSLTRTVSYYRSGSAASVIDPTDIDNAFALHPRILHISGITPALSASCLAATIYAVENAPQHGITMSFDVNYRPILWADRRDAADQLQKIANAATIVFVGLDEAQLLWGIDAAKELPSLLTGPDIVVVKDGSRLATAYSGDEVVTVSALPVDVVEPVGAGDAFAAGWLHGYLGGLKSEASLRLGHLMARIAMSSVTDYGAYETTTEELERIAATEIEWSRLTRSFEQGTGRSHRND